MLCFLCRRVNTLIQISVVARYAKVVCQIRIFTALGLLWLVEFLHCILRSDRFPAHTCARTSLGDLVIDGFDKWGNRIILVRYELGCVLSVWRAEHPIPVTLTWCNVANYRIAMVECFRYESRVGTAIRISNRLRGTKTGKNQRRGAPSTDVVVVYDIRAVTHRNDWRQSRVRRYK